MIGPIVNGVIGGVSAYNSQKQNEPASKTAALLLIRLLAVFILLALLPVGLIVLLIIAL